MKREHAGEEIFTIETHAGTFVKHSESSPPEILFDRSGFASGTSCSAFVHPCAWQIVSDGLKWEMESGRHLNSTLLPVARQATAFLIRRMYFHGASLRRNGVRE